MGRLFILLIQKVGTQMNFLFMETLFTQSNSLEKSGQEKWIEIQWASELQF